MTVGERIKEIRNKVGMSQVDFADKINVSKQTLYKYENNIITNIPSDKIEAAAQLGNVAPSYLMGWDTNSETGNPIILGSELNNIFEKLSTEFNEDKDYLISRFFSYDLNNLPKEYRILNEENIRKVLETSFTEDSSPTTIAAHFDGDEYTEDELDEIRQFAEFVKNKRK